VATVFCSRCGRNNPAGSSFCQGCGAPLAAPAPAGGPIPSGVAPTPGAAPAGWAMPAGLPVGSGLVNPTPGPGTQAADVRALTDTKAGAVFAILGFLLSVVGSVLFSTVGGLGLGVSCTGTTCSTTSVDTGVLAGLFALIAIGLVFGILSVLKFRSAFQTLVPVDYRFRSPASLSILVVIGSVLLLIGFGLLLAGAAGIINSCSGSYNFTNCNNAVGSSVGALLGGFAALGLGGLLAFIGEILVLIGIWRLGTRYNEGLLKVGAIFVIIPFLDIIAPFLIYFGANSALKQRTGGGGMVGAGMSPFSPPGTG